MRRHLGFHRKSRRNRHKDVARRCVEKEGRRAILLSGECDLELDDGKTVHLTQGAVVVQRGTMHAWVNNGTQPCAIAFVLIDATPAQAGGQILRTHYPR